MCIEALPCGPSPYALVACLGLAACLALGSPVVPSASPPSIRSTACDMPVSTLAAVSPACPVQQCACMPGGNVTGAGTHCCAAELAASTAIVGKATCSPARKGHIKSTCGAVAATWKADSGICHAGAKCGRCMPGRLEVQPARGPAVPKGESNPRDDNSKASFSNKCGLSSMWRSRRSTRTAASRDHVASDPVVWADSLAKAKAGDRTSLTIPPRNEEEYECP